MNSRRGFLRGLAAAAAREAGRVVPDDLGGAPGPEPEPATAREPPPLPAGGLSEAELERYSRQLVLPEWSESAQLAVRDASVLVLGAGALGSPVALYLAGAGVGRLAILDDDAVELSNLHRQLLHYTPDLGTSKAHSAAAKLRIFNPEVLVEPYQVALDAANAETLLADHDLIVDCSDAFATRYTVNAACCASGTPLVEGGVLGLAGVVMAILPGETACYRCAFPERPPPGAAPTCAEAGVLGPAAGVIGSLQALEALKLLTGVGTPLTDGFLQLDLGGHDIVRVRTARREDCPDCGGR